MNKTPPNSVAEPYLGTCPNLHPHGLSYRLQHKRVNDGVADRDRKGPRALLCPWCDFEELKRSDAVYLSRIENCAHGIKPLESEE